MNLSEYENKLKEKIISCIDNTCYTNNQIENMVANGLCLFSKIFSLNGSDYIINDEEKKEGVISIKSFHFNHNDMLIYFDDYFTLLSLKEIFTDWKDKKYFSGHKSNGHGTAIVIPFECDKKINDFEQMIKRISVGKPVDDFDEKLKKIKYV
jgi:hypothetical protein